MSDWVIRSKLAPPMPPRLLLSRERLVRKLDMALERRATVLHAPAGFGKTSLLADWHHALQARAVPSAWLSLDEHDRDLVQFLRYLMEALRSCGMVSGTQLLPPPTGVANAPESAMVGAVLTELAKRDGAGVLVLDDFHRADSTENCRAINQLLSRLPDNTHLVLSTREYPAGLSLADLRAREALLEIDHADLQFSKREIEEWLGPQVEQGAGDWSEQLKARTEGWPIALNTVHRWLTEGTPPLQVLEQLSGRNSDLSDYFLEQVFDNLEPALQSFLMKTSILERINGDLANRLCETGDAWVALEELERRDLFVESLDRERLWYRYHRLFAEFLQERTRRRLDGQMARLHQVASGWFREQGLISEAIQHALASRAPETVADLFELIGGWHHALKGHFGALERALGIVDDPNPATHPRLWLGRIFLMVRRGEVEQAETLFKRLAPQPANADGGDPEISSELSIMRSLLNRYADRDISAAEIERLEQLSGFLQPDNDLMHAVRCNLLCVMHAQRGDMDACMAAGDKAIRHFRAMGSVFGETFIYFHEGYVCMEQGRLRDAEALYGAGRDLALEHFGEESDLAAIASAFLAEAAYERNDLTEAERLLDFALPHIERFDAWLEVYVAAYATAMKLARFTAQGESVRELRNRARATAESRGLLRLRAIVDLQQQELDYLGESAEASHDEIQAELGSNRQAADPLALRRLRISVLARSRLRSGDAERAAALLQKHCARCREEGRIRSFVSHSILLATAHWAQGERGDAVAAFEQALAPSLFEGIKRPFIDEGEALAQVIGNLTDASERQRGNRIRDRFLAELALEIGELGKSSQTDSDELTGREREVLRHLIQGRSNREIAEAMPVSINTVKFHLKNIFEKLGVSTRKDAVSASLRNRRF